MSATEVAQEINLLNGKLQGRLDESFIPVEVRRKLTDLEEIGEIKQKDFLRIVSSFYKNTLENGQTVMVAVRNMNGYFYNLSQRGLEYKVVW